MNYHKITYPDTNNGDGCRATLWVSGCDHHCEGCHNPETWDKDGGIEFTEASYQALKKVLEIPYIKGLTLSGGDPLFANNYWTVLNIARRVKEDFPDKDIWLYTGYYMEQIQHGDIRDILDYVDVVVDGPFIKKERNTTLRFRGSNNQSIWLKDGGGEWCTEEPMQRKPVIIENCDEKLNFSGVNYLFRRNNTLNAQNSEIRNKVSP
ncbi:MAG: anaerobic ribonucleoside-triphosphate reductase activating protein [Bacteroidales bacterium]|nr:anaerobic ribonucleoside-triphosphate reductase activating protein [Bacteroidales bacterium]